MPRAKTKEAFVWQAATAPERARLFGAIAIALSSGCLGVLAGRWSVPAAPLQPQPTRTAALIEAVAKETQARWASRASHAAAAPASAPAAPEPAAGGQPAPVAALLQAAGPPAPVLGQQGQTNSSAPAAPEPTPPGGTAPARARATDRVSQSEIPSAATAKPAAPNYQALRDYVLSR
jgi:hypothetical protein